jgi:hypothetical protein
MLAPCATSEKPGGRIVTGHAPQSARTVLALRVGVTGARNLRHDQVERHERQLNEFFSATAEEIAALRADQRVDAAYATGSPKLVFLSPLALGADRLAARVALDHGYALHVPMPFARGVYETDFTGSPQPDTPPLSAAEDLAQFRSLLDRATGTSELDGNKQTQADRSYEAVGRFVVRHCDLLVALWDGGAGNGRGGTADIVGFAAANGVPVWWIHATEDRPPVWIADPEDLHQPPDATQSARLSLAAELRQQILPPSFSRRHRHGWIAQVASWWQPASIAPEQAYFVERHRPRRWASRAYSTLMRWASGLNPPWSPLRRPELPLGLYWFERYTPADELAGDCAASYRSSYVWVFFFGILALLFGALALAFGMLHRAEGATFVVAGLELVALLAIITVVGMADRFEWHERSIEYRLLAELCRKQQVLAPLGRDIAAGAVRRVSASDRATWVAWLFGAWQRTAPLPAGRTDAEAYRASVDELIAEQIKYHKDRRDMSDAAGLTFIRLGAWSFVAVLICVVLKMISVVFASEHDLALVLGLLATVLPGISAAFVGIRAYAELQLLAEQSRHMLDELERARTRIARMRLDPPLAAQDLGAEATQVATLMLQDLEGWARLFWVKGVESG